MSASPTIRFAAMGLNHGHIYDQVNLLLRAGAQLVAFYALEPDLQARFQERYPDAIAARAPEEILEDESIQLVASAGIPCERAPLGIRVMRHGKDYMSDKPAFTTLAQLAETRQAQAETGRIFSVCYSERFENAATVRAGELARAGAIGQVVQTIGLGPHRANLPSRAPWFFQREKYGGIITDIGAHQMDQFLFLSGSQQVEIVSSTVANYRHPQYPGLEDYGEVTLHALDTHVHGHVRVDWYTPDGLATWGDGRLFVLGTEGYIEARKYIDISGRPGGHHVFWSDHHGTHYEDCSAGDLPYGRQLIFDVLNRTETAMTQAHAFLASELALQAEAQAVRLGHLKEEEL